MSGMPAPGWYPDPDGSPRLRYFDGRQWTPNTAPLPVNAVGQRPLGPQGAAPQPGQQYRGQRVGSPQHPTHPGGSPPGPGRRNLLVWVAFGLVVAMILGVGTWLVIRRVTPPATPLPTPSVAQPSDPVPDPSPPSATDSPPATESPPVTDPPPPPSPSPPTAPVELPPPGTMIEPLAACPATASDAVGEQNAEGRYSSAAGLSMPAADGFVASAVQFPWLHGSNSQIKEYDYSWMASFTVGEARAEDGFTETIPTAVAMVACLVGSDFYASADPSATVSGSARAPEGDGVKLTVDVAVPGATDVTTDAVHVLVVKDLDVMHVLVATVPDTDPAAMEALDAIYADLRVG